MELALKISPSSYRDERIGKAQSRKLWEQEGAEWNLMIREAFK